MKKNIIIAAVGLIMFGCENHEKELISLNRDRDSLMSLINERDSSLYDFMNSYNEIENSLDAVTKKQNVILSNSENQKGELKSSTKDRINSEIDAINTLMEKNKKQIAELKHKLNGSNVKVLGLEKLIKVLNDQIVQKDTELSELNNRLSSLNVQVAQLQTSVDTLGTLTAQQSQTIANQTTALHTAYFVVGESKELQKSNVIDKTGGVLGLGKSPKLNDNLDNSKFTKIDYTQIVSIPVNSNAKIITTHPEGSYELEKDGKDKNKIIDVRITNPEKFWSTSKYLVVMKN